MTNVLRCSSQNVVTADEDALITKCHLFVLEFVQGGSETSNVVRVGDGGTDEKTGGLDGGGRVEDVTILVRSDKNGHDQE